MEPRLGSTPYSEQTAFTEIHKVLMTTKLSHYKTKSFAAHEALGKTYDAINDLIDSITEKLIGYSGKDPADLPIGTITATTPSAIANMVMKTAERLEDYAESKKYCDIENLAQELSGVGAQLMYLSRFQ